jgi:replicative DNA helicase
MTQRGKYDWIKEKIQNIDDDEALMEVAETITDKIAGKDEEAPKTGIVHITELDDELAQVRAERGKFKGVGTGYTALDNKMGGFTKGGVVLIGGETSNGKSALATNMAIRQARSCPVLYISLEMTQREMLDRIDFMTEGKTDIDLMFQQTFDISYKELDSLIANAIEQGAVRIVYIDYLQYLGRGMDEREVAKMSLKIKKLALKHNITMAVIVSLRKGDAGKNKRKWTDIENDDLMGTAAIAYDADTIVIASRRDQENDFDDDHIYVKILKARNTKLDYHDRYVQLKWDRTRITEEWSELPKQPKNDGFKEITLLP